MDMEKTFKKWYRKICLSDDSSNNLIDKRWEIVQEYSKNVEDTQVLYSLLRVYFNIPENDETVEVKEKLIQFIMERDSVFDEDNKEEIVILVGGILACLLESDICTLVALYFKVLGKYYESRLRELDILADEKIKEYSKENKAPKQYVNEINTIQLENIQSNIDDLCGVEEDEEDEEEKFNRKNVGEIVKDLNDNFSKLYEVTKELIIDNQIYQEQTRILSWLSGEWSDILEKPLTEIDAIAGACVLGIELSDLICRLPGPYAGKAFIYKMLSKCKDSTKVISLTELVDGQELDIRKYIGERYEECEKMNLLTLSAIRVSLEVDEAKEWIPMYKKRFKINPDEKKLPLLEWSMLLYEECIITKY